MGNAKLGSASLPRTPIDEQGAKAKAEYRSEKSSGEHDAG
jgi:hypothetical protein